MTDKEKLEKAVKLADAMYYAAQYLTTDASRLHKAMKDYHNFMITEYNKQEPASDDLDEVSEQIAKNANSNFVAQPISKDLSELIDRLSKRYQEVSFAKLSRIVVDAVNWQQEQDKETIELAEDHAMLAGMMQEREKMMKDAVECNYRKARLASGHYLSDLTMADVSELTEVADRLQLRDRDKVKVIIIKE